MNFVGNIYNLYVYLKLMEICLSNVGHISLELQICRCMKRLAYAYWYHCICFGQLLEELFQYRKCQQYIGDC